MAKVKGSSLRRSIVWYIAAFLLLALALIQGTGVLCQRGAEAIREAYPAAGEKFYLTTASGERLGDGVYLDAQPVPLSAEDRRRVELLESLPMVTAPVYSGGCILAAALLFYRNKLKKPLTALGEASEKIAENDLDFSLSWESEDELGRLCRSFEEMRATLAQNFDRMWRQMEERRRLNAAFAHDLRTPLTVLKGCSELLQESADPTARETARTMERHIDRIRQYVDSMSRLARLEDSRPNPEAVRVSALAASLREEGEALCRERGLRLEFRDQTQAEKLPLDPLFVTQVGENLLSNAARFAAGTITLTLWEGEGVLALSVRDDGPGFTPQALTGAAAPYFTEAKGTHFGLGLYICKLLCEGHGGRLEVENLERGARVTGVFSCSPGGSDQS